MFLILLFTVIGFFIGFIYVINKRRIRLGRILGLFILGLISTVMGKIFKDYYRKRF
ncbi:MAG: hypothetical protein NC822_03215 [Candidatus Omnitrophica bacterium]|nr:hypothetical protein [Candidatus Omnitrophota bacterium]MCM8826340.1 hypothetical protein [Candidatus Omnitrophota bacterium]